MVIPCRVDNYKLKCKLTYAVGCKCSHPAQAIPSQLSEFQSGLELISLDLSYSWLDARSLVSYHVREKECVMH